MDESTHANDHELAIRGAYLNTTFFYTRVFFYFFYFCLAGLIIAATRFCRIGTAIPS